MVLHAYSVYDRKAVAYHPPFYSPADGHAVRTFSDLANDRTTMVGRHPSDYVLYRVGGWDDRAGQLLPFTAPEHVIDALALVTEQPELPLNVTSISR